MPRFMCVYFISGNEKLINKENKRTKVIESLSGVSVLTILQHEHSATYIKSIRDLEKSYYYIYNNDLNKIEYNNEKLIKDGRKKK